MPHLKNLTKHIFQRTLAALDIPGVIERKLLYSGGVSPGGVLRCGSFAAEITPKTKIFVVAVGKAAHRMVSGISAVLPEGLLAGGIVCAPAEIQPQKSGWQYFVGGHPLPNQESWRAGETVCATLGALPAETLVLFLISGGASALIEKPLFPEISLADVQLAFHALVTSGASIDEINCVRKHLSAVKGGRLATIAAGCKKLTLAISDVPAGRESALGSGPTIPDPSTVADAHRVLSEYALMPKMPASIAHLFETGKIPESPKKEHSAFADSDFVLLMGTDDLFHPAHRAAEAAGCITHCDNTTDDWPIDKATDFLLAQLDVLQEANPQRRVALIAGGEVSSPVTGDGIGGRNSAFVLNCVAKIRGKNISILSLGTDGVDGNSPAAGAIADGETFDRAAAKSLDIENYFARSDSYNFFAALDDAIVTGPTGNNLRDLRILLSEPASLSIQHNPKITKPQI